MIYSEWIEKTQYVKPKWYEFDLDNRETPIPDVVEWLSENIEPAEKRDPYDYHTRISHHGITIKWVVKGVYVGEQLQVRIKDPRHALQFKLMGFK